MASPLSLRSPLFGKPKKYNTKYKAHTYEYCFHSKWEKEHDEKLLAKSKEESENHQKALAQGKEDTDKFFEERKARCEAKRKQNAEEEEARREALKKILEEGDPWVQSAKLIDYQKAAGAKDSSRMRHVLISLKH